MFLLTDLSAQGNRFDLARLCEEAGYWKYNIVTSVSRRFGITLLNAMMAALVAMCLVFMTFPDRVPGENFQQTLFRKDMNFDDITVSENVVLEASKIETVTSCARLCAEHSKCESFFYNRVLQVCSGQPSSLDTTTAGFSQPGSKYFKQDLVIPEKVNGSCFHNATETASSSAAEAVCGPGKMLKLAEVGNPTPLVTREMIVDGHCMEDRWNSGTTVSFFCIRHCLMYPLDSTQDCTSAVIQSQYVCL
ncbi:uncharacterized protein LOC124288381 isoform X1 [Haliotis rubra]|uniref:uncharacterized protein LOC124288381 isoform X1 n=1 Tax=Haliotis rubra TaxID=36100 RepID=UPI001EE5773C|nr:uncharacterized protein LOC124288381 isoform X1 [Haliotis rubra]